jgi:hypothetical protein
VSNLGISIEPTQVRLITGAEDPYAWKVLPEKKHLFEKHMSKHSIGAYMELWRGVGVSFEAVLAAASTEFPQKHPQESADARPSFTARIEDLQIENAKLSDQLNQWRDQVVKESESKRLAEEHASRLKADNQELQQEVQKLVLVADHFRGITIKSSRQVMRVLEKLKSEVHSFSSQDTSFIIPYNTFYGNEDKRWEAEDTDDSKYVLSNHSMMDI